MIAVDSLALAHPSFFYRILWRLVDPAAHRRCRRCGCFLALCCWRCGSLSGSVWGGDVARRLLMATLALIWGIRLGTYVLTDRVLVGHEDGRYAQMRKDWGDRFPLYIFRFYQYQAMSVFGLAIVFMIIAANPAPLGVWGWITGLIVLIGIGGETLADRQLKVWRTNPANKGKSCRGGLLGLLSPSQLFL